MNKTIVDPSFPDLAEALDEGRLLNALQQAASHPEEEYEFVAAKIYEVQHRPSVSCRILCKVKLRHRQSGRSVKQFLSARPLGRDECAPPLSEEAARRYAELPGRVLSTPRFDLQRPRLVAYLYPVDPDLPGLLSVCDPDAIKGHLESLWASRRVRVRRVDTEVLGFRPGARASLAFEVESESKTDRLPEIRRLVGKLDANRTASESFARSWALWRAAGYQIGLAPPVGYLPGLDMTLQERVAGTRLSDLAETTGIMIKHVRQLARALSILHGLELPLSSRRTAGREVSSVQRWRDLLFVISPDQHARVERLSARLAAELARRVQICGPVHADLHPSNVLANDDRLTLIDVDNMAFGDPVSDVGRFMSALRTTSLRLFQNTTALNEVGEAFLEQYLLRTSADESRVRLFEAAALLTSAATGFRLQRPGWEQTTELLLGEAERALAMASSSTVPVAKPSRQRLSRQARSRLLSDSVYMQALLERPLQRSFGVELTQCHVRAVRETSKTLRARYRIKGQRDGVRWERLLVGTAKHDYSGRRLFDGLVKLNRALDDDPHAPLLPHAVVYVGALGLSVFATVEGVRLPDILVGAEAAALVSKLARALVVCHGAKVELPKKKSPVGTILAESRAAAATLASQCPALGRSIDQILAGLERMLPGVSAIDAPGIADLRLDHIRFLEGRVVFADIKDVTLLHPLWNVAEITAELAWCGLEEASGDYYGGLSRRFHEEYFALSGLPRESFDILESASLFRLAGRQAQRVGSSAHVAELVNRSAAILRKEEVSRRAVELT